MNAVQMAVQGRYSEFSDSVKSAMKQKMASHEITQKHTQEFDRYQDLKQKFAEISGSDADDSE